jgi:flagellar hook-length control protein FliK
LNTPIKLNDTMMQTTSLPIQLNATAPAQRNNTHGNGAGDGKQFGVMLSSEMEQRQLPPAPAPAAAAPKAQAPKPRAADKPAQPDDAAPQQAAKPEDTNKADADNTADATDTDGQDSADEAQASETADPASAMLALMASLQQPAQDQKAGAAAQAFDALGGAAGKGKRGDAAQLAALQAAMKSVTKDGAAADTAAGKTFMQTGALRNPALAAGGAALGAEERKAAASGADAGADLRAVFAAGAGKPQGEPQLGSAEPSAELALQQARETAAIQQPDAAALAQAQPAVMEAVQAAAGATDRLSARVGTDAWENQVGQKIVYMVGSEEQTASLTLNPPDLGPMQVVLSVTNDQASVTFSANQEEVRQALEDALPRLREMMSESGIALGNATVNAGMQDGRQDQAARGSGGFGNGNRRGDAQGATVADNATRPVTRTTVLGDRGMVDTFA